MFRLRCAARALLTLAGMLAVTAPDSRAQSGDGHPPHHRAAAASSDTTEFFPPWLHPWLEIGGGWIASPGYMHHFYDSGQGFAAGVSTSPWRRVAFRVAADYQMMQSHHDAQYVIDWGSTVSGAPQLDTLSYQFEGSSWSWTMRGETGVQPGPGLWLTGGLGAGYMNGGFEDLSNTPGSGFKTAPPASMLNGWGWTWTAAARWDIEPDPAIPLGIDLRTTSMRRGSDFVRWWSIRLCYRIPNLVANGPPPPR